MPTNPLTQTLLDQLSRLDSSAIADAIELFDVRLRNTGFADSNIHCMSPDFPKMIGYAVTVRIRTSAPPMEGSTFTDRTDWWKDIVSVPAPRIVVVEDLDTPPGLGSFLGEVHANILSALGCIGVVTNGAVRDLAAIRALRLRVFARNLSVSHSFAHITDFGEPVIVARMKVQKGDLVHGDSNGVQTIPRQIAPRIPDAAAEILRKKEQLVALCQSRKFTLDKISATVRGLTPVIRNAKDNKDSKP